MNVYIVQERWLYDYYDVDTHAFNTIEKAVAYARQALKVTAEEIGANHTSVDGLTYMAENEANGDWWEAKVITMEIR